MKGFKGNQKQFATNFQTYYNFIKPHMSLHSIKTESFCVPKKKKSFLSMTPAQKAGIKQKPEWKDILIKAVQNKD
jgi:hypothetical protein